MGQNDGVMGMQSTLVGYLVLKLKMKFQCSFCLNNDPNESTVFKLSVPSKNFAAALIN